MAEPTDGYLNIAGLSKRYNLSRASVHRLRTDPKEGFPEPAMFIRNNIPLWSLDDLRAWEAKRRAEHKGRTKGRGPIIHDSSTTVTSRRSRARQKLPREQTERN